MAVPTIYFLDICSISHIKHFLGKRRFKDKKHEQSIKDLRDIDLAGNAVSCLPALMEKASDRKSKLTTDQFVVELQRDLAGMGKFFSSAKVAESAEFVETQARDVFGTDMEDGTPEYLAFLEFANSLRLHGDTGRDRQFKTARLLCDKAEELGVSTSHPVVITVVARVYKCEAARDVLKFAGNPENFNASNALGDIQAISRVGGRLAQLVGAFVGKGKMFQNWGFRTGDSALVKLFTYFTHNGVEVTDGADESEKSYSVKIDEPSLFPELFGPNGEPKDDTCSQELDKLRKLLGARWPED